MRQPLLQQPGRPAWQRDRFGGGAAFDIPEQDGGVAGPVDVADIQIRDPVRDNAAIGPEQHPVGDHDCGAGEQLSEGGAGAAMPDDPRAAHAEMHGDLRGAQRAVPGQQPAQVAVIPAGLLRVTAAPRGLERPGVDGEGVIGDPLAGVLQPFPLLPVIGRQRITRRKPGETPPVHQGTDARAQGTGGIVVTGEHRPRGRLPYPAGLQPVLRQHCPRERTRAAADPAGRHEHGDVPQPDQIRIDGPRRVHRPVRVDLTG